MGIWNKIKNIMNEKETNIGEAPTVTEQENTTYANVRNSIKEVVSGFDAFGEKDDIATKDARLVNLLLADITAICVPLVEEGKGLQEALNISLREDAYYPQNKKDRLASLVRALGQFFVVDENTPLTKIEEIFTSIAEPLPASFYALKKKDLSFLPKEVIDPVAAADIFYKCSDILFDLILFLERNAYDHETELRRQRTDIHRIADVWPVSSAVEKVKLYEKFLTVIDSLDSELKIRQETDKACNALGL